MGKDRLLDLFHPDLMPHGHGAQMDQFSGMGAQDVNAMLSRIKQEIVQVL